MIGLMPPKEVQNCGLSLTGDQKAYSTPASCNNTAILLGRCKKKQRFRDSCLKESLQKAFRGQLLLEKSQFDHKLTWPLLFQQWTVAYSFSSYFIFNFLF